MTTALILLFALAQPGDVRILEPTMYHGDEIDAVDGEIWLGLFGRGHQWELRPVAVRVERVNDPILDAEDEATGKAVSVEGDEQPILLIHGLNAAKSGPVPFAHYGDTFLAIGESILLPFKRGTAPAPERTESGVPEYLPQLAAVGAASDLDSRIAITSYTLKLFYNLWTPGSPRQILAEFGEIDLDGAPRLLWAGDLDNDRKLDLLLDLSNHYNVRKLTLFLSTKAAEGELVGKAAELTSVGC